MPAAAITLAITQAAGLVASYYNPRFWAEYDAKAIRANGSQDTLLSTFHRQRATWRLAVAGVLAVASTLPAFWLNRPALGAWLLAGQLTFNLLYFFAEFNPRLNLATGVDYKSKYYVSWNPKGSWMDAQLWARAWRRQGHPMPPINGPHPATQELAGEELRYLSWFSKWLGYAFYFIFAVAGYAISYGF